MITELQAQEVAARTQDLLEKRGWCLWGCEVLGGEVIVIARDDKVEVPEGYVVYTDDELKRLFSKPMTAGTVRLIHEAKKRGARVLNDSQMPLFGEG